MSVALVALLACSHGEFASYRAALRDYDDGRTAMEKHAYKDAAAAFDRALSADPESPLLIAWVAQALTLDGQLERALAVLDAGLVKHPQDTTLHYNRGAVLARKGNLDDAATEIRGLVGKGLVTLQEVRGDTDFQALANEPRFADLLPPEQVRVGLDGEDGAVLLGESYTLRISVESRDGQLLSITDMGEPSGLLYHLRTVENVFRRGDGFVDREIEVTWRTIAPGTGTLGPWLVAAGGTSALTDRAAVDVTPLEGRATKLEPLEKGTVYSPEALLAGEPVPWAGRLEVGIAVKFGAGTRHELTWTEARTALPPQELVYREAGQPIWTAWLYAGEGPAHVAVRKQKEILLETTIE